MFFFIHILFYNHFKSFNHFMIYHDVKTNNTSIYYNNNVEKKIRFISEIMRY